MSDKISSNFDSKPPSTFLPHKPYTYTTPHGNLAHRLDIRFPWLKLVLVLTIGIATILNILDITVPRATDPSLKIRTAPMSKHIHATERDFSKKLVALTFDDGPSSATTPDIIKILSEKDVLATFFMLGNRAKDNSDIVEQVRKAGHDIASHTLAHQNLIRIPISSVQDDISESTSIFQDILGHPPVYVRPPYGNTDDEINSIINAPVILWSVDTLDWNIKDAESIVAIAMDEIHDGAIILMHDIYPTTVEALPLLIDTLKREGYEFVTISELTKNRGVQPVAGKIYYNFPPNGQ